MAMGAGLGGAPYSVNERRAMAGSAIASVRTACGAGVHAQVTWCCGGALSSRRVLVRALFQALAPQSTHHLGTDHEEDAVSGSAGGGGQGVNSCKHGGAASIRQQALPPGAVPQTRRPLVTARVASADQPLAPHTSCGTTVGMCHAAEPLLLLVAESHPPHPCWPRRRLPRCGSQHAQRSPCQLLPCLAPLVR